MMAIMAALLSQPLTPQDAVTLAMLNNAALQAKFEEIGLARAELLTASRPHNPLLDAAVRFPDGGRRAVMRCWLMCGWKPLVAALFRRTLRQPIMRRQTCRRPPKIIPITTIIPIIERAKGFHIMLAGRSILTTALGLWGTNTLAALAKPTSSETPTAKPLPAAHAAVTTLNGHSLPYVMKGGVKEFHLIAQEVAQEFAPGMVVKCWGYNGGTPGPTIEAVEGDRVRILVTNKLPEHTTIHWHGLLLPNGMDGVGGPNQPHIKPGETYAYEFTLRQSGTYMYHPHADEMLQIAVGMMGFFIIHPRDAGFRPVDRDFVIMMHEWAIHPGTSRPDPAVMLDFNIFTLNGKVFPAIDPLVVRGPAGAQ